MKRRDVLKAITGGSMALFPTYTRAEKPFKKPNVIFILTDDQGYGPMGCHGDTHVKTPHLNKLHSESIRFTNFHVKPNCAPTRAMVLTGRHALRNGVWATVKGRSILRRGEVTMADVFKSNKYSTAIYGKWHLGDNYPFRPQDRGFDEVLIHGGGGVGNVQDYWANDYFDDMYCHNEKWKKYPGYCTDVWFSEAMRFIDKNKFNPFFCYISTNAPHLPLMADNKYIKMYQHLKKEGVKEFYAMVTNIDDNIGRLRKKLKKLGLEKNTIFIFMSDNGQVLKYSMYNAGMNGGKGTTWEGGDRVLVMDHQKQRNIPQKDIASVVMTEKWRLVDNKILNDIVADPGQESDVVEKYPEVAEKLKTAYEKWWKDISVQDFKKGHEIIIGSDFENPVKLTSHDLVSQDTDVKPSAVWNHDQVLAGVRTKGYWEVEVAKEGDYEFSLRRYPREANHPILDTIPVPEALKTLFYFSKKYSYAENNKQSKSMPATFAVLKTGDFNMKRPLPGKVKKSALDYECTDKGEVTAVKFQTNLKAGNTYIEAWFGNEKEEHLTSAYYVYVRRLL